MNSLRVKGKIPNRYQCKSSKQVFYKFGGQFNIEGQGHKFLKFVQEV